MPNDQDFYPELTQSPEESKLALVISQRNFYEEQAVSNIREDLASPQTRVTKVGVFPENATEIEVEGGENWRLLKLVVDPFDVVACVKSQIHQFSSHSACGSSGLEIVPFLRLRAGKL